MSVVGKLKSAVGLDDETEEKHRMRCTDCGNEFVSYKPPERAVCGECMSEDLDVVENA
jgi:Zn finger protein HypA/HybF involved in hydrogenase expression